MDYYSNGTKIWAEINHNFHEKYDTNSENEIKTTMLKPVIYDYSD